MTRHVLHLWSLQQRVNVCSLPDDLAEDVERRANPSAGLGCLLRDLAYHAIDFCRVFGQVTMKLEIRIEIFFRMDDQTLTPERGINSQVTGHMADDTNVFCARGFEQSVIGIFRKLAMHLDEIVPCSFFGDYLVPDLIGSHEGRLLNEDAGRVKRGSKKLAVTNVVSQGQDLGRALHVDTCCNSICQEHL